MTEPGWVHTFRQWHKWQWGFIAFLLFLCVYEDMMRVGLYRDILDRATKIAETNQYRIDYATYTALKKMEENSLSIDNRITNIEKIVDSIMPSAIAAPAKRHKRILVQPKDKQQEK